MAVEKRTVSRKYYKKLINYKHLNNQHDNFQKPDEYEIAKRE